MPLVLNGATSGSATLQSTDATTTTITLPSTTGTLVTSATQTFSKSFVSSQTIPSTTSLLFTVAHSMGVVPKILRLVAVCLTTQYGWPVGAEGQIAVNGTSNGNLQTFGCLADATNVYYGSGSSMLVLNFTSGDYVNIVGNSNFGLKIYAYA